MLARPVLGKAVLDHMLKEEGARTILSQHNNVLFLSVPGPYRVCDSSGSDIYAREGSDIVCDRYSFFQNGARTQQKSSSHSERVW